MQNDSDGVWRFSPDDCSLTALKEPPREIGKIRE